MQWPDLKFRLMSKLDVLRKNNMLSLRKIQKEWMKSRYFKMNLKKNKTNKVRES